MNSKLDSSRLAAKHLERRLAPLRSADDLARPPKGWIKAMREALGMTATQLARRIGVSQPRVTRLERAEIEDGLTLRTLRHVAEGLDCTLVYALVPNAPLETMIRRRTERVAEQQLARGHHTMALENQALTAEDLAEHRDRLIRALLDSDPRRLWDDP